MRSLRCFLATWAVALTVPFVATAYGPPWNAMEGTGVTSTGIHLAAGVQPMRGPYVVAVDPGVIPYGTQLKIWPNPFGNPNIVFTAADTGGAIVGRRIDFYDSAGRASQDAWGRRPVQVSIVGHNANLKSLPTGTPAAPGHSPPSAGAGAHTASASGGGGADWLRVLLDVVLVGAGSALTYRGAKRALSGASL